MEESIYLYSRGDRLGSHLIQFLSIIIYAYYNNLYIVYEPENVNYNNEYFYEGNTYPKSFIVESLLVWIDKYNQRFPEKDYSSKYKNINIMEYLLEFEIKFNYFSYFYSCDLLIITTQVLYNIKSDLLTYFKKYIRPSLMPLIENHIPHHFMIPFNPKKTILVHLRMGDVKDRPDYNGEICAHYYADRINRDEQIIQGIRNLGYCNMQTPLSRDKVERAINEAKNKYPDYEVVMITQPGNYEINYPYRCIRNDNENYDLHLLCSADVLIMSRSTFSLSAAFLGNASEIWCPLWGHFVTTGLSTKYDKTSDKTNNIKINYFY
jgi:hypothetical protein